MQADPVIELLAGLPSLRLAEGLEDVAAARLEAHGYAVRREVSVQCRGDGRKGRVDMLVSDQSGGRWAIEFDRKTPRRKSVHKLLHCSGTRVVVLRDGRTQVFPPRGIDAVVGLLP